MALTITFARPGAFLLALLLTTSCAAGQEAKADPCVNVHAAGLAITEKANDPQIRAIAAAQHVVSNPDCYKPDLVAQARILLAQPTLPPPTWLNQIGVNNR